MTTDKPSDDDPFAPVLHGHADWLANHPDNLTDDHSQWNRGFSFECGPGWAGLLTRLFDDLGGIIRPTGDVVVIRQIKEKFGTLRVYWRGSVDPDTDSSIDDAILLAAFRSEVTCEICGKPGQMRVNGFGRYHVACAEHAQRGDRIVARATVRMISAQPSNGLFYATTYDPVLDAAHSRSLSREEYESLTGLDGAEASTSPGNTTPSPASTSGDDT